MLLQQLKHESFQRAKICLNLGTRGPHSPIFLYITMFGTTSWPARHTAFPSVFYFLLLHMQHRPKYRTDSLYIYIYIHIYIHPCLEWYWKQ